jgi:hypothetical protein
MTVRMFSCVVKFFERKFEMKRKGDLRDVRVVVEYACIC